MKRIISITSALAIFTSVHAQLYVSNDASVSIGNSATISVKGNVLNNGIIQNDGTFRLSGNFDNQKNCNSGGTFILTGGDQTIYHKNTFFSTLICSGTGIKTFTSNISITKQLELISGLIKPQKSTVFLMKKGSTINDGNTESYIDGMLYWEGSENHYFPIGKGNLFAPAECQNIKGDSSIVFGFEVENPNTAVLKKGLRATSILQDRFWKMNILSGTFTEGTLSLSYSDEDNFTPDQKVGVAQSSDSLGAYDMLRNNSDVSSRIGNTGLMYTTSLKPINKRYFALGNYILSDMSLFFVPNALSKFASNQNDQCIKIYGDVFEKTDFSFTVSNQWGNIIYKTNSVDEMATKGWDGTNTKTHRRETTGQYFYVLKAKTFDGDNFEKAGSIWIID